MKSNRINEYAAIIIKSNDNIQIVVKWRSKSLRMDKSNLHAHCTLLRIWIHRTAFIHSFHLYMIKCRILETIPVLYGCRWIALLALQWYAQHELQFCPLCPPPTARVPVLTWFFVISLENSMFNRTRAHNLLGWRYVIINQYFNWRVGSGGDNISHSKNFEWQIMTLTLSYSANSFVNWLL